MRARCTRRALVLQFASSSFAMTACTLLRSLALATHRAGLLSPNAYTPQLRSVVTSAGHWFAASADTTPDGLLVVPMPKLSHTMTKGRLVKWLKQPGDRVNMYDVLFEVATDELTEEVFKVGDFAGTVHLVVEAHEEGWLAQVMQQASDNTDIQVGTPVAVVCEEESQLQAAQRYQCPTRDVYDSAQPQVPVLTWQSFLKQGSRQVKCMG